MMMDTFSEYDSEITSHDSMTTSRHMPPIAYYALKLNGEAGEIAERVGKLYRDNDGVMTSEIAHEILLELGDVLWYVTRLARILGFSLARVAVENVLKLMRRRDRGKNGSAELQAAMDRSTVTNGAWRPTA